eukprot:TRINITY_DN21079_c1_g1_i2.p1 TRINITY_DN21079_c1_g1~~TRINITY_DN21079_c1_g1_i2.p1  ORF type:complete len:465 (-),score=57.89 TRINITY_DN21079_c1_g1_i2:215-1453(-)
MTGFADAAFGEPGPPSPCSGASAALAEAAACVVRVTGSGASKTGHLAGILEKVPHVDPPAQDGACAQPLHGTIAEFRDLYANDEVVQERLRNKVRVCTQCGKPCAITLASCNSCGASFDGVDISFTDNIFMGFVYGVSRGKFPYTISTRMQTPELLCFDDPLSMSVCHLNVIPTDVYIPDCRYLFSDPARGLALINRLFEAAATVSLNQFWGNDAFRQRYLGNEDPPSSTDEIASIAFCGMNCPPSMYQLHLQFIHPPLLPFHFSQALRKEHFHYERFFPLEYLNAALSLGERAKMKIDEQTQIRDIIEHIGQFGVEYDKMHAALIQRCVTMQERFGPWNEDDFAYQVYDGHVFTAGDEPELISDMSVSAIQKSDTAAMQNYGRPYVDGSPSGGYYLYPKRPCDVSSFVCSS